MTSSNPLIDNVVSDLNYLRRELSPPVGEHAVRRASAILRRLLVDGELGGAWRAAGSQKEPQLTARSLNRFLTQNASNWIRFASAGKAEYLPLPPPQQRQPGEPPAPGGGLRLVSAVWCPDELPNQASLIAEETLYLTAFMSAPCLVVWGVQVSRRALVKYVANKLGGVHFDPTRGTTDEDELFKVLDQVKEPTDMNAIYYELLSIGQALLTSRDVVTFVGSSPPA